MLTVQFIFPENFPAEKFTDISYIFLIMYINIQTDLYM